MVAIRAHGLTVNMDEANLHVNLPASDDPRDLGPQDAVLVTVKTHALQGVANTIGPLLGPQTSVVFIQNGIPWWYYHGMEGAEYNRRLPQLDPGDALWNAIGPQRVIGAIASSACTLSEPGIVQVRGGSLPIVLGEPSGALSPRVAALAAILEKAKQPIQLSERILDRIWMKLALNLSSGPLSVLTPIPLRDINAVPAFFDARHRILDEVATIAASMGCVIQVDHGMKFASTSQHIPSIGQDMLAGRKLEIDSMFLTPLQMARENGVSTPILSLLTALAIAKAQVAGLYP